MNERGMRSWGFLPRGFSVEGSSGFGQPTHPPSHPDRFGTVASLGFRSLHGCGAAGDFHPSSAHPPIWTSSVLRILKKERSGVNKKIGESKPPAYFSQERRSTRGFSRSWRVPRWTILISSARTVQIPVKRAWNRSSRPAAGGSASRVTRT